MSNATIHRILTTTALCLAAVGLSSCTIVDTGGAVNNVGRYIPVDENLTKPCCKHSNTSYTVYTYQDTAYLEIPVRVLTGAQQMVSLLDDWWWLC